MSIVKTSLPAYVEQNSDKLLRAAIMGAETTKLFTLQVGVKTKTALNLLSTQVKFQDGSSCGFNADGTSTLTQRTISAPIIKVNMSWCDKDLLNTCLQHAVRVAAGTKVLPFEEDFVGDVVDNINLNVEKLLWQGDTDKSSDDVLKWTDGVIKILKASDGITVANQKLTHTDATPEEVKKAVDAVVMAIPTAVIKDAVVMLGYDYYRSYIMALQALNLYHNAGDNLDKGETLYQGSSIKIKALSGLDGTGEIVAGDPKNFYFGTDLQGDTEKFDLWYSKDNQEFRFASEFGVGTQVAFPNQCVISSKG